MRMFFDIVTEISSNDEYFPVSTQLLSSTLSLFIILASNYHHNAPILINCINQMYIDS